MLNRIFKSLSRLTVLLIFTLGLTVAGAQRSFSSLVWITTVYSQNEKFYLKSIPYDDEAPSLRGKSAVYEKGSATPLYVLERGFDDIDHNQNNLFLSNDGQVIFYLIRWGADEEREELKSVTIYRQGKLLKSYTEKELTGCDENTEHCRLVYSNYNEVIDQQKSWGRMNGKVFKAGTSDREKFLSDFPVFSFDDTVYLTDSRKRIHLFDLTEGKYLGAESFDHLYEEIKDKGRLNQTEQEKFESPTFLKFPKLKNGKDAYESLASYLGMKAVDLADERDEQYKRYSFKLNGNLYRDGSLEIEELEVGDDLPKEKIIEFFKLNKFDRSSVPTVFEKWNVEDQYFYFRKKDARLARQEKQQQLIERRLEFEKRMTLESIDGIYIPKDLGECFTELDRLLREVDRKEMQALTARDQMIAYHMSLGMWMRNNWGLWGGSRLRKYFTERGVTHPDDMSGIILEYYFDWLHGQKESWKDWEKQPRDLSN